MVYVFEVVYSMEDSYAKFLCVELVEAKNCNEARKHIMNKKHGLYQVEKITLVGSRLPNRSCTDYIPY